MSKAKHVNKYLEELNKRLDMAGEENIAITENCNPEEICNNLYKSIIEIVKISYQNSCKSLKFSSNKKKFTKEESYWTRDLTFLNIRIKHMARRQKATNLMA